jgi:DNA-binding NarL/FixJ family response regulator
MNSTHLLNASCAQALCWVFEQPALKGLGLADALAAQLCTAQIQPCDALPHQWPAQPPRLLLVDAARPPQTLMPLVARLRSALPGVPLVFLGCTQWDDETLADACLPAGLAPSELVSHLLALAEELYRPASSTIQAWESEWAVSAPDSWADCDSRWPAPAEDSLPAATPSLPLTSAVTRREQQIIALLARGLSARVVAQRLFISEGTVRKHRENLRRKLDLRTTAELAVWAASQGLLSGAMASEAPS